MTNKKTPMNSSNMTAHNEFYTLSCLEELNEELETSFTFSVRQSISTGYKNGKTISRDHLQFHTHVSWNFNRMFKTQPNDHGVNAKIPINFYEF